MANPPRSRGRITRHHAANAAEQGAAPAPVAPPAAAVARGSRQAQIVAAGTTELTAPPRVAPTAEVGAFGTQIFAGLITDEYNPALQGQKKFVAYEQMRRADGMIRALLNVLKLPIRSAVWTVEPADPDDEDSVDQAKLAENALLRHMDQTWADALRDALLCVDYGFMLQEIVWGVRDLPDADRAFAPRYLAFRHPATVFRWNTNPQTGHLVAVTQLPPPRYDYRVIPADKLVLYSPEQEGANFEGISHLRAPYKHWFIKERLYVLQAIALSRSGMGIPWVKTGEGASKAEEERALQMATTLTTSEQAGLSIPKGFEVGVLTFPAIGDFQGAIDHHNRMIAISYLAQFLDLGSGGGGSWALSQDQSQLLLNALNALADHVAERISHNVIRPMIRANFKGEAINGYPRLTHGDIGLRDAQKLASSLSSLISSGAIRADDPLEDRLRDLMQVPERDPKSARPTPGQAPPMGGDGAPGGAPGQPPSGALIVDDKTGKISGGNAPSGGGNVDGDPAPDDVPTPTGPNRPNVVAPEPAAPLAAGEAIRLLHLADLHDGLADALEDLLDDDE